MYNTVDVLIPANHPLFDYCSKVTHEANNLYNAAVFRERQCVIGLQKPENERHALLKETLAEIEGSLEKMNAPKLTKDGVPKRTRGTKKNEKNSGPRYVMPTAKKPVMNYQFLDDLFKVTQNPDYCGSSLTITAHTAQMTLREVAGNFFDYFKSLNAYWKNPDESTGLPKLPGYLKPGGMHTAKLSNTYCKLIPAPEVPDDSQESTPLPVGIARRDKKPPVPGHAYLQLPNTNLFCDMGPVDLKTTRLMQAEIIPHHGVFTISVTTDTEMDKKTFEDQ